MASSRAVSTWRQPASFAKDLACTRAARSPVKPQRPHRGAHTAEIRSEITPEMAEISKGNGGGNNEILAKLQRNIEKGEVEAGLLRHCDVTGIP